MDTNDIKHREYEKIFTGTNQNLGYDKIFLEFSADTKKMIFKVDNTTYFHFPEINTDSIPLSTCGLIEAGAVAGAIPYRSDRIWKKNADYKKYMYWGDSEGYNTGVWLCSWLSGNNIDKPVWIDRWYNPGKINYDAALASISSFDYSPASAVIVDINSEMTLDPGVWYRYDHMGNDTNNIIVNELSGTDGLLKLHINEWTEEITDLSSYGNLIYLPNYNSSMILNKELYSNHTGIRLDGVGQYCKITYDNNLKITDKLTASVWLNTPDWNQLETQNLFGNEFRGGWSIRYDNGFYNPIFAVCSNDGNLLIGNIDGTIITQKQIPSDNTCDIIRILVDYNNYIWVLDNGLYESKKHLYRIDYNGDIVSKIDIPSITIITDIAIAGNTSHIYIGFRDDATLKYGVSAINMQTLQCSGIQLEDINPRKYIIADINYDYYSPYIEVDQIAIPYQELSNAYVYDYWTVLLGSTQDIIDIYRSSNRTTRYITDFIWGITDSQERAWIIYDQNKILVIDTNDTYFATASTQIDDATFSKISMSRELKNGSIQDIAWITDTNNNTIYRLDENLNIIDTINLKQFECTPDLIDINYEWNRKFNYYKNNKISQIKAIVHTDIYDRNVAKYPITSALNNEWNLFAIVYNHTNEKLELYINGINKNSISTVYEKEIYYEYKNPIGVGASIGKVESLGQEFKSDRMYFDGSIDDVRIYNILLNESDLYHIYRTKYDFKDIIWDMPIRTQYFLEEIDRFFKCKIPGLKSQFYNLKIKGLNIDNEEVRDLIEGIIKDTLPKVSPAYTKLYNIIWE